jgi:hypothetical protein
MVRKGDPDRIRPEDADVEIGATVKARKLLFRRRPQADVELHGEVTERGHRSPIEATSGSERENLPEEVQPGVTYRDVRVRWRAAGRFKDPKGG